MPGKASRSKTGRPLLPPEKRRGASMGFRPTPNIRVRLEEAAAINNRSLSGEIEARLEGSFDREEQFYQALGGRHNVALVQILGSSVALVEAARGTKWTEDLDTSKAVLRSVPIILEEVLDTLQREQLKDRGGSQTPSKNTSAKTAIPALAQEAAASLVRSLSQILGGAVTYPEPIPESTSQTKSSKPKQVQSSGKRRIRFNV